MQITPLRSNKLALVYWKQGKYIEAEALHKRALAIREKALAHLLQFARVDVA